MPHPWKPGDLVQRKEGGPVMVVDEYRDKPPGKPYYVCRWRDGNKPSKGDFYSHLLTDADPD